MAVVLVLLVWLGWTGQHTRTAMHVAAQKAVRVAELRGTIAYLDEWLTMSAQMAAATGERQWSDRYEEAAPKLDAAIAEATELAPADAREALVSTTTEAHRDLVTMERRALSLAAAGDLAAARVLLNGPEFAYLKDVYAAGIEVFGADLKTLANARATDLNERAWLEATGLGLSTIFLIATALSIHGRTHLRRALARTAVVARTDDLTNLPNRRRFYEDLDVSSGEDRQGDRALLLIDLDRFKAVNDAYGHPAGDQLLKRVAARLNNAVCASDLVARLGGDEFAVVIMAAAGGAPTASDAAAVAGRIVATLREPFTLENGALVQIGASVGVALAKSGDADLGDLMYRADVALYRAKADGRGCFRFFAERMDADVRARALLEGDLRQAIADDVIVPHFQPLVAMDTRQIIGVEMLARWPHSTFGLVPPAEFIPLAEQLGLIGAMTERLLLRACRAATHWPNHVILACNISPLQLQDPGLPAMIRTALADTGLPPHRLELEITESALVGDLALARTLLDQLKTLGVSLALDDFGTGYSSLRHLQSLPFDKIKIDQSFVGAMAADRESCKIVSAVIGLGHSLGLKTVAEGVDAEETAGLLRDLGCDVGQGWLFGRPSPAGEIDALVGDESKSPVLEALAV